MNLLLADDVLSNPDEYVREILSKEFIDLPDGEYVFKGIQPRTKDEFEEKVLQMFPNYTVQYNFVRKSPLDQEEPNFIHTDEMMGDVTALIYLNKVHPKDEGTIFYDDDNKISSRVYMKYNRMVAFSSEDKHSRADIRNFGEGDDARLIQVIFLKEK